MGPPAEQLVRDYLSRLSAAARGQLGPDDRRALVSRTREFIERKTGGAGPPTGLEVARLLAGLGDPARLVSKERQRLAELRGQEVRPPGRGRLARMLRGDRDGGLGASWHWPAQEGNRADLQFTLLDAGSPAASKWGTAHGSNGTNGASGGRASAGPVTRVAEGTAALMPLRSAEVSETSDIAETADVAQSAAVAEMADVGALSRSGPAEETVLARQAAAPANPGLERAAALLVRLARWSRRNKLEATAVVLLGIGGAIFPPVWLAGAAVALASRLWDLRDKWLGLAVPVLLTVIGIAGGIAAAGSRGTLGQHLHEGWVFADVISRLAALPSAGYLAWRSARGRRLPSTPPWSKPRKIP